MDVVPSWDVLGPLRASGSGAPPGPGPPGPRRVHCQARVPTGPRSTVGPGSHIYLLYLMEWNVLNMHKIYVLYLVEGVKYAKQIYIYIYMMCVSVYLSSLHLMERYKYVCYTFVVSDGIYPDLGG